MQISLLVTCNMYFKAQTNAQAVLAVQMEFVQTKESHIDVNASLVIREQNARKVRLNWITLVLLRF